MNSTQPTIAKKPRSLLHKIGLVIMWFVIIDAILIPVGCGLIAAASQ